jgi:hypothetical protein
MTLSTRLTPLCCAAVVIATAACSGNAPSGQPTGVTVAPLAGPSASTAPTPSPASFSLPLPGGTDAPSTRPPGQPPVAAGGAFRDDFDGETIDASRWAVNDNDGLVVVRGGRLIMVGLGSVKYPRLISRVDSMPATGPRYLEVRYESLWEGEMPGFNLDYTPTLDPDEPAVSTPWVSTGRHYSHLTVQFNPFGGGPDFNMAEASTGVPGAPHTLRYEFDADNVCRVLVDNLEVASRKTSSVPPLRFWIGNHLLKARDKVDWTKLAVDYIESGVLKEPTKSRATPTPVPTPASPASVAPPSVSPDPAPLPSPVASPDAPVPSPSAG